MLEFFLLSTLLAASPGTLKVHISSPARVNVIGSDSVYYEPANNPLHDYSLKRKGNRSNVTPLRYLGSFFYTPGDFEVQLPPGIARVEVSRGYAYYNVVGEVKIEAGKTANYDVELRRVIDMPRYGWHSTDTHVHLDRSDDAADRRILQLLSAEDVELGHIMTANSAKGYGMDSLASAGAYSIVSGREVTMPNRGHVNLMMFRHMPEINAGMTLADVYDKVVADGGAMQHDHAGYGQEIYEDAKHGKSDAVELLQFGLYRPQIGIDGYYQLLNSGLHYPLLGASDYPVCRFLSDSRTYVADGPATSFPTSVGRLIRGESFATSGPLLFMSVKGESVEAQAVAGDLPIESLEIVQDGKVIAEWHGEAVSRKTLKAIVHAGDKSWVAARCSGPGTTNAHTNPYWFGPPVKIDRFPVGPANVAVFPPVLPRPKGLASATIEGMAVDRSGQPLAGVEVTVRAAGTRVRTDARGHFTLRQVDINRALFLRLSKPGYATTNTAYLNPRAPNLRIPLLTAAEIPKLKPNAGVVMIGSEMTMREINLQPAYPPQTNEYEPNVILKDYVLPLYAGQVSVAP